jgi:hypothetical protein
LYSSTPPRTFGSHTIATRESPGRAVGHHDRNRLSPLLDRRDPGVGGYHDHVHLQAHQLGSEFRYPLGLGLGEAAFQHDVLAFSIPMFVQPLVERFGEMRRSGRSAGMENTDAGQLRPLLRLSGKGRGQRASQRGQQEAATVHHSIT